MKKWSFVALLLVGATILGATVLREPIAQAAQSTAATIVGPLDANGNVKVHEQGTAKTQEQNVDVNGNVKVHEQGTATVKSGDQTQVLYSGTLISPSAPLDVSAFKEIRVMFSCQGHGLDSSAGLQIYTVMGQSEFPLDRINQNCPGATTRTYEIPGTSIRMTNYDITGAQQPVDVAIFGRSN